MKSYCKYAFDHQPGEKCEFCGLDVDEFGNTEQDFYNCSFPCCGCDGSRLCMASNGPSSDSIECNIENMYNRTDSEATKGKMKTIGLSRRYEK